LTEEVQGSVSGQIIMAIDEATFEGGSLRSIGRVSTKSDKEDL